MKSVNGKIKIDLIGDLERSPITTRRRWLKTALIPGKEIHDRMIHWLAIFILNV